MFTIERLLRGKAGPDANATLDHPLEHLVACHGRIEERLAVLERAAQYFETSPAEAREAALGCFRYFDTSGVLHTRDEEESVFPRLTPRLATEHSSYLAKLEAEHQEAGQLYNRVRQLPDIPVPAGVAAWRDAVARFCALYRSHIASENQDLIRLARAALTEGELATISSEMKRRRALPAES
jgi:hemerythrin-like domain-containing protein